MIQFGTYIFRRVTIIGVGLMGGSIGKAIKKNKLAREVIGLSQRYATLSAAIKAEAIDHGYHDIKKAVSESDLIILATPVGTITGMLAMIGPHLRRHCIVMDVGSTKASIVSAAHEHLPKHVFFVGAHPLAGSEKKGVVYADENLLQNTICVLTPIETTNRFAFEKVKRFWTKLGSQVKTLSPEQHDKILSYVSHVPHVLAYALMEAIPQDSLDFAAQGLKDTTRIASSSPEVWNDICMGNPQNIIKNIDEVVNVLSQIRKSILSRDEKALMEHFKSAKTKRDSIIG